MAGALMIWDGSAWQVVSQQGPAGNNSLWVGPSAPPGTPVTGDEWFDTDEPSTGLTLPLSVANGGTGAASAPAARTSLAMPGEELAYNQITANIAITTTNSAGSNLVIEGTTRAYDGSPVIIEFFSDCVQAPNAVNTATFIQFLDGPTDLGVFGEVYNGTNTVGIAAAVYARRRITPTAGTHNYRIGGYMSGSTSGSVFAGAGTGGGIHSPAYIRVIRA
jgi:hypothetical protein